ncbi:hypothetical protein [Catellatospora citrea]|uniref:hypothetical protein n=1 Tax=Catellatospora citrea TaxID=53366 RepID=UPI00147686C6|nr:hypothetical protein [Catellatospora citrea]
MDTEVLGDLLDRHADVTGLHDPHDVVRELTGVGLGHSDILFPPAHRASHLM